MKALSLWQPWAWLVANGHKLIENRPWAPPASQLQVGDRFAIHASKTFDVGDWGALIDLCKARRIAIPDRKMLVYGAVIATVQFDGVVHAPHALALDQQPFFAGPVGWRLSYVRPLVEPVPCRGMQKLWTLPSDAEQIILERERRAA